MKKTIRIIAEVCLAVLFVLFVLILAMVIKELSETVPLLQGNREWYKELQSQSNPDETTVNMVVFNIDFYQTRVTNYSIYTVLGFLAIAACVFLFVYCNPRLFRLSTWENLSTEWAKNKSERLTRKQAKSETDKQKRIEELQKELDALKKDDTPPSED